MQKTVKTNHWRNKATQNNIIWKKTNIHNSMKCITTIRGKSGILRALGFIVMHVFSRKISFFRFLRGGFRRSYFSGLKVLSQTIRLVDISISSWRCNGHRWENLPWSSCAWNTRKIQEIKFALWNSIGHVMRGIYLHRIAWFIGFIWLIFHLLSNLS